MNHTEIFVGIDGSISSARALEWAAAEAEDRSARLVVVYASAVVDSAAYSSATLGMIRADAAMYGERLLAEAIATVAAHHPALRVTTMLWHQRPADVLSELSGPHSLVVVGSRGANRVTGVLLGSVSQRVAGQAAGTVVVVGNSDPSGGRELGILVGVTDSAGGRAALEFGCAEAAQRGSRVTAVRAYEVFGRSRRSPTYGPPGLRAHEATILRDAVSRIRTEHPGLTIDARLVDEAPTAALPALAFDAELLVLGCRHPDDRWPSRLGPVTTTLLHHSPCPVAVVGIPRPAREPESLGAGMPVALTSGA
ncbi:MAG: universal stress protein [Jatrophihabitantaceae bacterium]